MNLGITLLYLHERRNFKSASSESCLSSSFSKDLYLSNAGRPYRWQTVLLKGVPAGNLKLVMNRRTRVERRSILFDFL